MPSLQAPRCTNRARPCPLHRRYAVIDVETTGFDPRADRIIEIGCVIVEDARIGSTWRSFVNPERRIPRRISRLVGITQDDVACAPTCVTAVEQLAPHCAGATLVAHNAAFDRSFLPALQERRWLCTRTFSRRMFPEAGTFGNQRLRSYFGLDVTDAGRAIVAHRALDDALVTAHVLLRCLERSALQRSLARMEPALTLDVFCEGAL